MGSLGWDPLGASWGRGGRVPPVHLPRGAVPGGEAGRQQLFLAQHKESWLPWHEGDARSSGAFGSPQAAGRAPLSPHSLSPSKPKAVGLGCPAGAGCSAMSRAIGAAHPMPGCVIQPPPKHPRFGVPPPGTLGKGRWLGGGCSAWGCLSREPFPCFLPAHSRVPRGGLTANAPREVKNPKVLCLVTRDVGIQWGSSTNTPRAPEWKEEQDLPTQLLPQPAGVSSQVRSLVLGFCGSPAQH